MGTGNPGGPGSTGRLGQTPPGSLPTAEPACLDIWSALNTPVRRQCHGRSTDLDSAGVARSSSPLPDGPPDEADGPPRAEQAWPRMEGASLLSTSSWVLSWCLHS